MKKGKGMAKEHSFRWFKCRYELKGLNSVIQSTLCNMLIYNPFTNHIYPIWKRFEAVLLSEQSIEIRIEQTLRFRVFLKMD